MPKILEIVLNIGIGSSAQQSSKTIVNTANDLSLISGQKPKITLAKKSIAGFSLRKGIKIGCKVTLRRDRIYEFVFHCYNEGMKRTGCPGKKN